MATPTLAAPPEATASRGPGTPPESDGDFKTAALPGRRKVAIYLMSVGDRLRADLLRTLTEEEVHEVTREISLLTKVSDEDREAVLDEFLKTSEKPVLFSRGGLDYATSVLIDAFGPEAGKRMADRVAKSVSTDAPMIETLRTADPQQLAKIVHREHPQTIALILCHIGPEGAANLLNALPVELRTQVIRRMAALDQISPDIINKLARSICAKLKIVGESSYEACGGVRAVADVLNRIEGTTTEEILTSIATEDPALGTTIRQLMFIFDDFLSLSQDVLRTIVGTVDRKSLTLALKGASPQLKKAFAGVMSTRAADMMAEDIQALGPVRIRDVQTAQQAIIAEARKLQAQGLFSLHATAGDEFVD